MGDDDDGFSGQKATFEVFLDFMFGDFVDAAGSFIKNEEGAISQNGTS